VIVPSRPWQRAVVTALLVVPLVLVVLLSAPAWLVLPFLSQPRRESVLELMDRFVEWAKEIRGPDQSPGIG
jgi:hypothetical protein